MCVCVCVSFLRKSFMGACVCVCVWVADDYDDYI